MKRSNWSQWKAVLSVPICILFVGCSNSFHSAEGSATLASQVKVSCAHLGVPVAPTDFTGVASSSTVSLSWTASTSSGIANYIISRNGTAIDGEPANTLSYVDSALLPSTTYSYSIVAQNSCGKMSPAATLSATTLAGPSPAPSPAPTTNMLVNGSFESGASPWSMFINSGAAGTFTRDTTMAAPNAGVASGLVSVTTSFGNVWDVGVTSGAISLTANQKYTVSFYAKANTSRQAMVSISQGYSPYTSYFAQAFSLTSTWQLYSLTFTQPVSDSNVNLLFASGAQNGTMSLDAISFGTEVSPFPTPTPSPTPTSTITSFSAASGSKFYIDGLPVYAQNANKSWSLTEPDSQTLRFEVRTGDYWSVPAYPYDQSYGANRSEITFDKLYSEGTLLKISETITINPGPTNTAPWMTLTQLHATTNVSPTYCPFAIGLDRSDRLQIVLQSPNQSGNNYIYTSPNPVVRGQAMNLKAEMIMGPSGNGYVAVWLNGIQIVNFNGAVGATNSTYYWKLGTYRGEAPETFSADFSNIVISPH